ncbi:DUF1934 domain-containing protein [Metabacillus fastidiosus]|uniref:DUF1934 domain-containing protein n=1 Tax=Metabacillus fastidiosus TaxID=1458 RepID=UPI003D2D7123
MSISTPVQIKVLSEIQQEHDGEKEKIELYTEGECTVKGSTVYLRYEETHELGAVKTTVKLREQEVTIMRSGAVRMRQNFIEQEHTLTDYSTPFGKMQLDMRTKSLLIEKDNDVKEGKAVIIYDLQIGENDKHLHTLTITFKKIT